MGQTGDITIKTFGQWTVRTGGLDCDEYHYQISNPQLLAADALMAHMAEKRWCNMAQFRAAHAFAVARLTDQRRAA